MTSDSRTLPESALSLKSRVARDQANLMGRSPQGVFQRNEQKPYSHTFRVDTTNPRAARIGPPGETIRIGEREPDRYRFLVRPQTKPGVDEQLAKTTKASDGPERDNAVVNIRVGGAPYDNMQARIGRPAIGATLQSSMKGAYGNEWGARMANSKAGTTEKLVDPLVAKFPRHVSDE